MQYKNETSAVWPHCRSTLTPKICCPLVSDSESNLSNSPNPDGAAIYTHKIKLLELDRR